MSQVFFYICFCNNLLVCCIQFLGASAAFAATTGCGTPAPKSCRRLT